MGVRVWLGYQFGVKIQGAPLGGLLTVNGAMFCPMLVPVRSGTGDRLDAGPGPRFGPMTPEP